MIRHETQQERVHAGLAAYYAWARTVMPERLAATVVSRLPHFNPTQTKWFPENFLRGVERFEDERMLECIDAKLRTGRYSPESPLRILFAADGETLQGAIYEWGGPALARYLASAHPDRACMQVISSTYSRVNHVKCILLAEADGEMRFWGPFQSRKHYEFTPSDAHIKLFREWSWHEQYFSGVPKFIFDWYAGKPVYAWFSHGLHAIVEKECFGLEVRNHVDVRQKQHAEQKFDLLFMRQGTLELFSHRFDILMNFAPSVLKENGEYILHFYDKSHGDFSLCTTPSFAAFRNFSTSVDFESDIS